MKRRTVCDIQLVDVYDMRKLTMGMHLMRFALIENCECMWLMKLWSEKNKKNRAPSSPLLRELLLLYSNLVDEQNEV